MTHPFRPAAARRLLAAATLLAASTAFAQEEPQKIELPAQSLGQSLNSLATQTGAQILFASGLAEGKQAPALHGEFTTESALQQLLKGTGLSVEVRENGIYTIRDAPPRQRSTRPQPARQPAARTPAHHAYPDLIQLDPIKVSGVVSASGFEQTITDAPASISVVTRQQLEKQSYTSIIDALRNVPGVYITGGGQSQDISIRGMADNYTLMLVDGRPISAGRAVNTNGADGGKQISLPPLSSIERIEVIRGPMASLYGSEAMGGVINIITRRTPEAWQGSMRSEYTHAFNDISNDTRHTEAYIAGPIIEDLLSLKINGAYTGVDESDYVGGGDSAGSDPELKRRLMGAELSLTPDQDNRIGLGYTYSTQETVNTPGKSVESTTSGLPSFYRFDKEMYVLTHEGRYDGLMLNSYLQHDVSDKVQAADKEEEVTTFNLQGTYFWGAHVLTFGGQYKDELYVNEENGLLGQDGAPDLDGAVRSARRWIGAIFTEVDWRLTEALSVTSGLRYNDDELFGSHLSPRLYGIFRLTPGWTLKGGVSTGYRQPTLAQATPGFGTRTGGGGSPNQDPYGNTIPRTLALGNTELDPETSINYEAGFVLNSQDGKLDASLMVFHTAFKDKIAEDVICESPDVDRNDWENYACPYGENNYYQLRTGRNIDKAMMQGVELAVTYSFTPALRLNSSYTYTESEQQSGEFEGEPLNKQPLHMFNALLDWQATRELSAWLQGNYRGKTSDYLSRTSIAEGTPGYGFVDAGVVYKLTKTSRASLGLYNITNKEVTNENFGVVLDGRRVTLGLTVDF